MVTIVTQESLSRYNRGFPKLYQTVNELFFGGVEGGLIFVKL